MDKLPDVVLLSISERLEPEETTRLALTCKRLYSLLPKYLVMKGEDFTINGPYDGHWSPEDYFEGPALNGSVKRLEASLKSWKDQGWGNRKGQLFIHLMRGETVIAKENLFGIAEHHATSPKAVFEDKSEVVSCSKQGDHYKFIRNAGGGGGHKLIVEGFRVVVTYGVQSSEGPNEMHAVIN